MQSQIAYCSSFSDPMIGFKEQEHISESRPVQLSQFKFLLKTVHL